MGIDWYAFVEDLKIVDGFLRFQKIREVLRNMHQPIVEMWVSKQQV